LITAEVPPNGAPPAQGAGVILKPKGGPKVTLSIEEFAPPKRFTDLSHLPLGKMRTTHEFIEQGGRTEIVVKLEIWGVLCFLWRKIVGENRTRGAASQIESFIRRARVV